MTDLSFYSTYDSADPFGATAGRQRPHGGADFPHVNGTPIPAVFSGTVVAKGTSAELGCYTQIQAANGKIFTYCHSQNPSPLSEGQHVAQGDTVNAVGARGNATGPHLHLAVGNGTAVGYSVCEDPWPWVQRAMAGEDISGEAPAPAPSADWDFGQQYADQARIQQALKNRGRYDGPVDGEWGPNTIKGIQTTIQNVGYTGPIDGIPGPNTCYFVQVYAQKFGDYTGPVDKVLGPNSWAGFALGLERP